MKNIDYLEEFFRKHNLSGKITVRHSSPVPVDEYMSDIIFENGDVISINDVIFDIDSEFPNDVYEQWIESKRNNDISLMDWIQTNTHYIPKELLDRSSIEEYQKEMTTLVEDVKESINKIFRTDTDEGDSDEDIGESEDN
jgi:hypothetical protein